MGAALGYSTGSHSRGWRGHSQKSKLLLKMIEGKPPNTGPIFIFIYLLVVHLGSWHNFTLGCCSSENFAIVIKTVRRTDLNCLMAQEAVLFPKC